MLRIEDSFLNYASPSPTYPSGAYLDASSPTANDGTVVRADTPNDLLGFSEALIALAEVIANGSPDTATASQRLEALRIVSVMGDIIADYTADRSRVGVLRAGIDVSLYDYVVHPPTLTKWRTNGATGTMNGQVDLSTGQAGGVTEIFTRVSEGELRELFLNPTYAGVFRNGKLQPTGDVLISSFSLFDESTGAVLYAGASSLASSRRMGLYTFSDGAWAGTNTTNIEADYDRDPQACALGVDRVFLIDDPNSVASPPGGAAPVGRAWTYVPGGAFTQDTQTPLTYYDGVSGGRFSVVPVNTGPNYVVAVLDSINEDIRVWEYAPGGGTWTQQGSAFSITGGAPDAWHRLCVLGPTKFLLMTVKTTSRDFTVLNWAGGAFTAGASLTVQDFVTLSPNGAQMDALRPDLVAATFPGDEQLLLLNIADDDTVSIATRVLLPDGETADSSTPGGNVVGLSDKRLAYVNSDGDLRHWTLATTYEFTD